MSLKTTRRSPPLECAEGDEPLAAADVEQRLALDRPGVVEDALAEPGQHLGALSELLRIAARAHALDPLGPAVLRARHSAGEDRIAFRAVAEAKRNVTIIGAALDLGQGRRGVDMGPSAMRAAGLEERLRSLGYDVRDPGNVASPEPEETALHDERARFLPEIKETCERVAALVAEARAAGEIPLVLGGDHSVALGTLGGLASVARSGRRALDRRALGRQHAGDEPERERPRHAARGRARPRRGGLRERRVAAAGRRSLGASRLIGTRELDEGEQRLLRDAGIRVFTMSEIDRIGIERAVREALDRVAGTGFVHVSLDMDVLDPVVAPGVGTPVRGGLTYREAHLALELVAESGLVSSLEVVEVNPILDRENTTALTAVELVASALGKKIL